MYLTVAQGVSFLEVKYQLLLGYLVDLTLLMSNKLRGNSIQDDPCIDRLVEIRTVSMLSGCSIEVETLGNFEGNSRLPRQN